MVGDLFKSFQQRVHFFNKRQLINKALERLEDAEDIAIIDERWNGPTVPWEDMKKRLKASGCL